MTSNIGSRQLKEYGQGVGFGTDAKKKGMDGYQKSIVENALKKAFANWPLNGGLCRKWIFPLQSNLPPLFG